MILTMEEEEEGVAGPGRVAIGAVGKRQGQAVGLQMCDSAVCDPTAW